jgi:protein O-mannosyl-transferase
MRTFFKKKSTLLYASALLLIFLLHITYLNNGFIWLDHRDIEAQRAIVPVHRLPDALFTRFGDTGFYRPLISLTESVDSFLYGKWALGYHLTNVLLHVIVVGLVPLAIVAFFPISLSEMLLVIILIGVHPFGWLPVGAISYRAELLLGIFLALALFFHKKSRITGKQFPEFLAVVCIFLALLSKETALFLVPSVIILWEITRGKVPKKFQIAGGKGVLSLFIAEAFVIILYLFLRFQAVPELWRTKAYDLPIIEAVGTQLSVVGKLLFQLLIPFKPALSDAVPISNVTLPIIIGVGILLFISILSIKKNGIASPWTKSYLFFLILLAPALGMIPVPRLGSPHYGYIMLLGFAPLVILVLRFFRKKSSYIKLISIALVGVWLLIASYVTLVSGPRFKNDFVLFMPEVQKDTHFLEGHFYLGNYYLKQGNLKQAEKAYQQALKTSPEIVAYHERQSILYNLALIKEIKEMRKNKNR